MRDTVEIELEALYADIAASELQPLWPQARTLMPDHPLPATRPWLWQWGMLRSLAERAGKLVTVERGGDRRVLALANPGLNGLPFATATMWGAIQFLGPHESAPAHRHTPGAIRFVIEGSGVWTTVNGDALDMEPGDLILTPGWNWHDHTNNSDAPMLWFDGLDIPIVMAFESVFFENYPALLQPAVSEHNRSEQLYGGRGLVPTGTARQPSIHSPLLRYRRDGIDASLRRLLAVRREPMVGIEFVNPLTGRPALPTFANEMHRLVPGGHTDPVRKTGSSIVLVFEGGGSSVIAGQRFRWARGDTFVIPSWAPVEHFADELCDFFVMTDRPALEALGLYREERLVQPQDVVSDFESTHLQQVAATAITPEPSGQSGGSEVR
jgi:gentisate 1,2-dioxygenase